MSVPRLLERLYGLLLLCYPPRFRRRWGAAMRQLFRDRYRRTAPKGAAALAVLLVRSIADVAVNASIERGAALRGRLGAARHDHPRFEEEDTSMFWRSLATDLAQAWRVFLRTPAAVTGVSVVTLALGIGANAAMFSVADAVLLRPLPFADPERIVVVGGPSGQSFASWKSRIDVAESLRSLTGASAVGLYLAGGVNVGGERPERLRGASVTPGFFDVLGAPLALGRPFTEEEFQSDAAVAVISDRMWRTRFQRDARAIGGTIHLDGQPFIVIGVQPPRVHFPADADVWVPTGARTRIAGNIPLPVIVARLAPGVTSSALRDEVAALPVAKRRGPLPPGREPVRVTPLREALVGDVRPIALLLGAAAALVLLVACINAANLLLARVTARARDLAVRGALGATRARLVAQLLAESALLAVVSALAAVPIAAWTIATLVPLLPPLLHGIPDVRLNLRVAAAMAALTLVTTLLFGAAPALSIRARGAFDALRGSSGLTIAPFWRRFRGALVILEVAVAIVLLAGAVTIVRTVHRLTTEDLGVRAEQTLTFRVTLPLTTYGKAERVAAFQERLARELRLVPGVIAAGATNELPGPAGPLLARPIELRRGAEGGEMAVALAASPGYFEALGIPLLAGRTFTEADSSDAPGVMIVSEGYARALGLSAQEILGRQGLVWRNEGQPDTWAEIVGVVRDVRMRGPEGDFVRAVYRPYAAEPPVYSPTAFVVRAQRDPTALVPAVRAAASRVDPSLPLYDVRTFGEVRDALLAERRFAMITMSLFAVLAFTLAAIGLYGVISYAVQLRMREIGIRLAIGAAPGRVLREVLASGVVLAGSGVALGAAASLALARAVAARVERFGQLDPWTLVALSCATLAVAAVATFVPARRATRIDPIQTLRTD